MTISFLQTIELVCAVIVGLAAVLVIAGKGLSMLWQWRFGNEIKATMARLESKLDEHLEWHAQPGGRPAKPAPVPANGRPPRHRPT